ncbi:replicative DNA helicase [Paenibacillus larvae subsp. larvae]|uniref:Replicative DNA helicase n=6 Tax=root TaxID=1 RepID=A0A345AVI0_9CAUD|nr:DnaB-like helicase C-terminal domain-containing protein [Paenibacillus larvae]YP_010082302.1 AAA family ATPase [Paenibacillus phage Halcyone]YP_010082393.1 AAA family ATPase [Paenibacillus phage Scottie]YP_010082471.1 AAA family ATPase [Paenibacillus phage Unity]AXF41003.1 replicative DNA helicase [Paenibacillus phage Heath]MEB9608167.1 DnaB-like helicase C-terminal domain-containing protein [Bacillus cereus]AQT83214.1 DNA helicase [Paenibacillus larvae subsp. pulvifaciens]AQZ48338.1 DNA 
MSDHGQILLSKVVDDNNVKAFTKYGISRDHFATKEEKEAFDFILGYAEENEGNAPSYAVYVDQCRDIAYVPDVSDSYEYLARQLKDQAGKKLIAKLFTPEKGKRHSPLEENYAALSFSEFSEWLTGELGRMQETLSVGTGTKIGRTLDEMSADFLREYKRREAGKSFRLWKTPFEALDREIGGFYSGDIYGIMAESGRGKTYLLIAIVDRLLRQGASVLVKSYEVKEYVWLARLISVATAVDGLFKDEETQTPLGIPNKAILSGKLEDFVRENFEDVVSKLADYYPGKLYFQGKGGSELTRTLDDLERELQTTKVDAVIIDPFYGLSDVYGRNANKTSGGAAEYAATRFEQIVGENDVVGFYSVQATVEEKKQDDEDRRELKTPKRKQVKTTTRLLDIATVLLGFDSIEKEGIAALSIEKGRNGGEDFRLDIVALLDYGVLREFPKAEQAAEQFTGVF